MAKKIFVGGLPLDIREPAIKDLFTPHGQVGSCTLVMDGMTQMSRGFAFVEMPVDDEANKAIEVLNGYKIGDLTIVVKEALAKTSYKGMDAANSRNRRFRR